MHILLGERRYAFRQLYNSPGFALTVVLTLALGLLIALISVGLMKSLLFGLQPYDPTTFAAAFLIVILVSLAASFLPARHAASIAPMQALRIE